MFISEQFLLILQAGRHTTLYRFRKSFGHFYSRNLFSIIKKAKATTTTYLGNFLNFIKPIREKTQEINGKPKINTHREKEGEKNVHTAGDIFLNLFFVKKRHTKH